MSIKLTDIFDFTIAGSTKRNKRLPQPWYTQVLLGKKRVEHYLVLMKPKDFIDHCYHGGDPLKEKYTKGLEGRRFAIPYIDHIRRKTEGLGRVVLCYDERIKEVPVLIVGSLKDYLKEHKIKVKEYHAKR